MKGARKEMSSVAKSCTEAQEAVRDCEADIEAKKIALEELRAEMESAIEDAKGSSKDEIKEHWVSSPALWCYVNMVHRPKGLLKRKLLCIRLKKDYYRHEIGIKK